MSTSPTLTRQPSRPSSANSIRSTTSARAPSPSLSNGDSVSIRNQMSTIRHSIRHQQAQLSTLESNLPKAQRRLSITSPSPPPSPLPPNGRTSPMSQDPSTPSKTSKRRSSYEILHNLAGPESSLPLPRPRDSPASPSPFGGDAIPEGIPVDHSNGASSPTEASHNRRKSSPTRSYSRIPISSVGNARALAEEISAPPRYTSSLSTPTQLDTSLKPPASPNGHGPVSPSPSAKRMSLTPGGTTKVLADLQTGVVNARNALENTKAQLRLSQRSVAQLTRQTEDLKEARERLRLENEGLNNVVARKERLLQEVLERARTAESEAAALKSQLKLETTTSKRSMKEMESNLTQATATSNKAEREYITLRDSVKSMKEAWKADVDGLREEMKKREERWRKDAEDTARRHKHALDDLRQRRLGVKTVEELRGERIRVGEEVESQFRKDISDLRAVIEGGAEANEKANRTAEQLAEELAHLRRLMRLAGRAVPDEPVSEPSTAPAT
ncbi:hypothetical protein PENSPDRAFT_431427 [Peniophora sp. CONT]|nr:hypothetical protein PENSPDRAFT_431427 [Peniophora sp. CONT]